MLQAPPGQRLRDALRYPTSINASIQGPTHILHDSFQADRAYSVSCRHGFHVSLTRLGLGFDVEWTRYVDQKDDKCFVSCCSEEAGPHTGTCRKRVWG